MSSFHDFLGSARGVAAAAATVWAASLLAGCGDDGRDPGLTSASASAPTTASAPTGVTSAGTDDPTAAEPTTSGTDSASETGVSGTTEAETTEALPSTGDTTSTSTSTSSETSTTSAVSDSEPASTTDIPPPPDFGEPPKCIECGLTIASQQSGSLAILGPNVFATAELMNQIVYALGTAGAGRFIASGDSSLPFNEVSDCPILEWLGGKGGANPKLFWFGWGPSDGPANWNYPGDKAGIHLPAKYIGNAALLAQDYDIVMYLEGSGQFDGGDQPSDLEMQTLYEFITVHGGGAYIVSEFAGYLKAADYASINRVLKPLGVEALQVNLNWGNVNGQIQFQCFPAPQ